MLIKRIDNPNFPNKSLVIASFRKQPLVIVKGIWTMTRFTTEKVCRWIKSKTVKVCVLVHISVDFTLYPQIIGPVHA